MLKHIFAALLCLLPIFAQAQENPRAILVLDPSGSMWGQIDGKAKITIAQYVIGKLLATLPEDQEPGLTVYGHRRKGDYSDIETLIQPGTGTRDAIAAAVNATKPKGKTPLSAAVIQAAEALKYTEEKATVILISNGRETCEMNPCEVGRKLEEAGIDFTAHVIGFDISNPQDKAQKVYLELPNLLPQASIDAPSEAPAGSEIMVNWSSPDKSSDVIALANPQDSAAEGVANVNLYFYVDQSANHTEQMRLPTTPGIYELRYQTSTGNGDILARKTIKVTEFAFDISAPDKVSVGTKFDLEWKSPTNKGYIISLAKPDDSSNDHIAYLYADQYPSPKATMTAPPNPEPMSCGFRMPLGTAISLRAIPSRSAKSKPV